MSLIVPPPGRSYAFLLIFALVPELKTSKGNLLTALNETGRNASSGLKQHRLQSWLVIAEVCIFFLVLVGTSLLVRSAVRLSDVDLGFNPKNLLTVQLSLPFAKYRGGAREINTYLQILERIEALRGIESAGAVSDLPVSGSTQKVPIKFSDQIPTPTKEEPEAEMRVVTESALPTLNVPLLAGRGFSNADTIDAPKVVLTSCCLRPLVHGRTGAYPFNCRNLRHNIVRCKPTHQRTRNTHGAWSSRA